jgi:hypothetical protein
VLQARKAFAAGDWAAALDLFAQLYAETLHPNYLRNIGRCHQKMGQPEKAIGAFRDYLAKARNVGADERKEIEGYIAEMEKLRDEQSQAREAKLAHERPQPPAPAPTVVATAPAAPPPPPPSVTAPAPAPEPESKPILTRWWFWTAVGAVAGGVIAAVIIANKPQSCPEGVVKCQ